MPEKDKVKITFIGDIFPGELSYTQDYGIRTQFKIHNGKPWKSNIKEIIGENEIVIGNLESPLIAESNILKSTFFGNPEFAYFLKDCGINVLNIANNHILEQGVQGFQHTINDLTTAKIDIIGQIEDSRSKIIYKIINGWKIAIAGFSNVDLHVIKNDNRFAVLNEINVLSALNEMGEQKSDFKILCFHWGNEYIHVPSLEQRKMAYKFIDAGANIIAGHHSHVIQPHEIYKGGHIFYSLGNFIFDFIHAKNVSIGLVASIELESHQIDIKLKGAKLSYKNTIKLLTSDKFNKQYSYISRLYAKYSAMPNAEYENQYQILLKRNHLLQRIYMKISIFSELIRIKNRDKINLVGNVLRYYLNILKRSVKN